MHTLIVTAKINPDGQEALKEYLAGANPMFLAAGGKHVGRLKVIDQLNGGLSKDLVALMEFPSADVIRALFDSEEYQALIPARDQAFQS